MDRSIEVEIAMGSPMDGLYQGHDGLIKAMTEFWSQFATYKSEITDCIPAGDDVVLAVTHHGTGAGSGAQVEMSHWQVATVRAGKLVRWRNFRTREQAFEAAGLPG
jgi:ketosteroid isomerase-like protein